MSESHELQQVLQRAARDLSRRSEATSLRYEHLDAIRSAPGNQTAALANLLDAAAADDLTATIHLARLLKTPDLEDAIAEAALRRAAPLEAKSAAIRALQDSGTDVPEAVVATLTLAENFVGAPDVPGLRAVLDLPEAWRQPTLDAWTERGIAAGPDVAAIAMEEGQVDSATVAERLGASGDERAVALLQAIVGASDRESAKRAKRALHQLRARGITVDDAEPRGAFSLEIEPDIAGDSLGYITGVDGLGGRILWMLIPNSTGGYGLLEAVIDDVHGIRKAEVLKTTRGDFRQHMTRLRENPAVLLAKAAPAAVAGILREAEALNESSATEIPSGYAEFCSGTAAPLFETTGEGVGDLPEPPAGEDARREALRDAVELLGAPYFSNWAILGDAAENAATAVRAAETSEVLVDEDQRKQQVDQAVAGVADSFDDLERARFKSRLHQMARVLAASGNSTDAARARVAGDGFETVTDLYADHPFARAIIQRGVMAAYQHLRQHEPPDAAQGGQP